MQLIRSSGLGDNSTMLYLWELGNQSHVVVGVIWLFSGIVLLPVYFDLCCE